MRRQKVTLYSLFCSISLITSGKTLSLSTWSRSTLAHFCSDSIMDQGRDISTTNTAKQSDSDCAETANLSRPLWYTSPSRIHTLQRVRSLKKEIKNMNESKTAFKIQMTIVFKLPLAYKDTCIKQIHASVGKLTISVLIMDT